MEYLVYFGLVIAVVWVFGAVADWWTDRKFSKEIDEEIAASPVKKLSPEEESREKLETLIRAWGECWEYKNAYNFDLTRWKEAYSKEFERCAERKLAAAVDRQFRKYGMMQLNYLRGLLTEGLDQVLPAYEETVDDMLRNMPYMFSCRNGEICLVNCPSNIKAFSDGMYNLLHKRIPETEGEAKRLLRLVEGY